MDYPIHRMIWRNDDKGLTRLLVSSKEDKTILEKVDPRGRTPLLLAVALRRLECVKLLLSKGANCLAVDKQNWSVMDEATATGDPDLLRLILQYRQYQLMQIATETVPKVLAKLRSSPDFYVEMEWSFSSWIPFVSNLLPSDTYKIWKSSNAVRIDTTLLGFENRKWKRGRLSLLFRLASSCAEIIEINHDTKQFSISKVEIHKPPTTVHSVVVPPDEMAFRLTNPVTSSYIDVDAISFERAKTGTGFIGSLLSFGNIADKVENVGGYECKVYTASDVKFINQKRTEHMLKEDKKQNRGSAHSQDASQHDNSNGEHRLASILSAAVKRSVEVEETTDELNTGDVTEEQYFNEIFDISKKSIGRPKEVTTKMQRFHATLWMSDKFPLSLQEQILPIIDLLAQRHSHMKKLREFITVHLPAGFPVKIDLPLYYVLTATVQQTNVHGTTKPVEGVNTFTDLSTGEPDKPAHETTFCAIDESVFQIPPHYRKVEDVSRGGNADFLSSTMEATLESHSNFGDHLASTIVGGSSSAPEPVILPHSIAASSTLNDNYRLDEDAQMQLAMALSLQQMNNQSVGDGAIGNNPVVFDEPYGLHEALQASLRDYHSPDSLSAQEEDDLAKALALSLQEK